MALKVFHSARFTITPYKPSQAQSLTGTISSSRCHPQRTHTALAHIRRDEKTNEFQVPKVVMRLISSGCHERDTAGGNQPDGLRIIYYCTIGCTVLSLNCSTHDLNPSHFANVYLQVRQHRRADGKLIFRST